MKFIQHYSSSKGNLFEVVSNKGKRLLIDPGVTPKKIQKALNYNLSDIEGCIATHGHNDHCRGVESLLISGIDVYASQGTIGEIGISHRRLIPLAEDKFPLFLESFNIYHFGVHHDAREPLGFIINNDDENMLFITDTSHVSQRFKNIRFAIIAIECSFDKDILQKRVDTCDINEALAKRLLTSHMEKSNTMRYLEEFCDLSKCRQIHLLHLSADNIDKEKTIKEFEEKFFIEVVTA